MQESWETFFLYKKRSLQTLLIVRPNFYISKRVKINNSLKKPYLRFVFATTSWFPTFRDIILFMHCTSYLVRSIVCSNPPYSNILSHRLCFFWAWICQSLYNQMLQRCPTIRKVPAHQNLSTLCKAFSPIIWAWVHNRM